MENTEFSAEDVAPTSGLVRQLIKRQFPVYGSRLIRSLVQGWDDTLFRLGEDFVVRLPRRALAAYLLATELRWLPAVAPRCTLPVPKIVAAGSPQPGFDWP
jgi:aminoglycoside phosphotransferase (APT) family kinase protein